MWIIFLSVFYTFVPEICARKSVEFVVFGEWLCSVIWSLMWRDSGTASCVVCLHGCVPFQNFPPIRSDV